jgi:hypothetical protein
MFDNITRLSEDGYRDRLVGLVKSAKSFNSEVAALAVDAILQYHEHNHDISRCQSLYEALAETGMGRQQTAFVQVLRKTTAQTSIGSDNWKGGKVDAEMPEGWESVIEGIADGGGAILMSYAAKPKADDKSKRKAKPAIKLPEGTPEPVINAAQKFLDGKTPEQVTRILTQAETTGPEFQDPDVQAAFDKVLAKAHEIEQFKGEIVRMVEANGEEVEVSETATDKLLRSFSGCEGTLDVHLRDIQKMRDQMQALKDKAAANDSSEAA